MNTHHARHRFALSLLVALSVLFVPLTAFADNYSVSSVYIDASVTADGLLQVEEERDFDFQDDVNGMYWTIPLGANQQGTPTSVEVSSVSVDGQTYTRDDAAESGDNGVYSVSSGSETKIKVFTPHSDGESASICISYTLDGAVMTWSDTAELYWKFVGAEWGEDSNDVTLTVSFPAELVAANPATVGKTLRAWGHGSIEGEVSINKSSATVTYTLPYVASGTYAEARVAFPATWVPQLAQSSASNTSRMSTILQEEQQWADEANAQRERAHRISLFSAIGVGGGSIVLLIAVIAAKLLKKQPTTVFQDTYFRDVPEGVHPATVAAFMNIGDTEVPDRAFVATLMKLTDERVIQIEQSVEDEDDYRISCSESAQEQVTNRTDLNALYLYFLGAEKDSSGVQSRSFKELKRYARKHTEAYQAALEQFNSGVKLSVAEANLVANSGRAALWLSCGIGTVLIVAAISMLFVCDFSLPNIIAAMVCVAASVPAIILGSRMRGLTQQGAELEAKCRALKKWLEDFTELKEAMPGDLVLWNKLMVMAVALGVSKKTLRELANAVPASIRNRDDFYTYYPLYWWCYGHGDSHAPVNQLGSAYHSAHASSSEGSGGGFSGGGGGGVGGGGGGSF